MVKKLNVGIVGLGYIGKTHAQAYQSIPFCFQSTTVAAKLKTVWRTSLGRDEEFIRECGFDIQTTDFDEFISAPLDLVDICTPTGMHTDYVLAATRAGKSIYCEKPLGKDLFDARKMKEAADQAGILTRVAFVMRYYPAIRQMKSILDSGEFGDVFNFRAHLFHGSYLNPFRPMSWRLRFSQSGGGAFSDLGAHMLDLVQYLVGDVHSLRAEMHTVIEERPVHADSSEMEKVDVDDWATCTVQMQNGAFGLVEAARTAAGVPESTSFQIFCQYGSLLFNGHSPEVLMIHDIRNNKTLAGPVVDIPRKGEREISTLWPSGKLSLGSFINAHLACQYEFMQNIVDEQPSSPDFDDALKVQEILEAAYTSAQQGGRQIKLPLD